MPAATACRCSLLAVSIPDRAEFSHSTMVTGAFSTNTVAQAGQLPGIGGSKPDATIASGVLISSVFMQPQGSALFQNATPW